MLTCDDVTPDTERTLGFDLAVHPWGHAAHAHTFGQLIHAISGRATFSMHDLDGTVVASHAVDTTTAIWIPPMTWHSARFEPDFSPSVHMLDPDSSQTDVQLLVVDASVRAELLAARWRTDDELVATRAALESQGSEGATPPPRPKGAVTRLIASALDRDPADDRSLDEWARDLHTSTATIRRAFKADTGLTYSQWRTKHRLHAALSLLRAGRPPSRVAGAVGYSDAGFAAAIRRQFGCAPSELTPRHGGSSR